jgi:hypothetical protein
LLSTWLQLSSWLSGASISRGEAGTFANSWRVRSLCHRALLYLYLADVPVPLLGTGFVETPQVSAARSIVHFILFLLCSYYGFIRKPITLIPLNNLPK